MAGLMLPQFSDEHCRITARCAASKSGSRQDSEKSRPLTYAKSANLGVLTEDPGVIAEEAEDQPRQQHLQIPPAVPIGRQRAVQIGHRTGRLDVHAGLFEEADTVLRRQQELEQLGLLGQVVNVAFMHHRTRQIAEVIQPQPLEIAQHRVTRLLAGGQQTVVALQLLDGRTQIDVAALVLDDQLAGDEGIDVVVLLAQLQPVLEGFLQHRLAHVEAAQQGVPVRLGLSALVVGIAVDADEVAQLLADVGPVGAGGGGFAEVHPCVAGVARSCGGSGRAA